MTQYSEFDSCIDLLTTPIENLSPYHPEQSPLLGSEGEIADFYIEPFSLELVNELLSKSNQEQKIDLIKSYVSRLMKSKNHLLVKGDQVDGLADSKTIGNNKLSKDIRTKNDMIIMDIPQTPGNEVKFKRGCNFLYHLLFAELQKCCAVYDIPFTFICKKLGFPLNDINTLISPKDQKDLPGHSNYVKPGATERLKKALEENGFFKLSKVNELGEESRQELIELICSNDVPYAIAMYDFLGFIQYYQKEYGSTRTELYKKFGEIFCAAQKIASVRNIQGNINDLVRKPENRDLRYTASLHKEVVKNDYQLLK